MFDFLVVLVVGRRGWSLRRGDLLGNLRGLSGREPVAKPDAGDASEGQQGGLYEYLGTLHHHPCLRGWQAFLRSLQSEVACRLAESSRIWAGIVLPFPLLLF